MTLVYILGTLFFIICSVRGQSCQSGYQPIGASGSSDAIDLLILSDSSSVRTLTLSGAPALLAGVPGTQGYVDGAGTSALFKSPNYMAVSPDSVGVMVADYGNNLIRRVALPSGAVSTYAGKIYSTFTAAAENVDGDGRSATFFNIKGLSFSKVSNRLIVSVPFSLIRIVTFPVPVVSTILGSITSVWGVVDGVLGGTGKQSGGCAYFISPDETFYISTDVSNRNIRRLDASTAQVTTIAGSPGITRVTGCADGFGTNAKFSFPGKVLFSSSGQEIFIADTMQNGVRRMNLATTEVSTLAGTSTACASGVSSTDVNILSRIFDMVMSSDGLYIYASPIGFTGVKRLELSTQAVTVIGAGSSLPSGAYGMALRPGLTGCLQCVPGTYSLSGQACLACPAGSFCDSTSTVYVCPAGTYCAGGVTAPSSCLPGDFETHTINPLPDMSTDYAPQRFLSVCSFDCMFPIRCGFAKLHRPVSLFLGGRVRVHHLGPNHFRHR